MIDLKPNLLKFSSDYSDIYLLDNGVVYYKAKAPATTMEQLKKELGVLKEITGGEPLPFLTDFRKALSFPSEQRVYVQETFPIIATSVAAVISSGLSSFIASIFLYLNRPAIPARIFKNEADALEWLLASKNT